MWNYRLIIPLVLAAGWFVLRGPLRAPHISTDFATVFASTRAWLHGGSPYADERLKQEYLAGGGDPRRPLDPGVAPVYPPSLLPIAALAARADWTTARQIWLCLNLAACAAALWATLSLLRPWPRSRPLALLYGLLRSPVHSAIAYGQPVVIAGALAIGAVYFSISKRPMVSGLLLGLAAAAKPNVGLTAVAFVLIEGQAQTLIAGGVTCGAIWLAALLRAWPDSLAWIPEWLSAVHASLSQGTNNFTILGPEPHKLVELQTLAGVFTTNQAVANWISYAVTGGMLAAYLIWIRRKRLWATPFVTLAVVMPLTTLVTNHRYHDLFLLLLVLPLCGLLFERREWRLLIPLAVPVLLLMVPTQMILDGVFSPKPSSGAGMLEKFRVILLFRHQPLLLLAIAWAAWRVPAALTTD